jgi:Lar family restriction alleviation protein
MTNIDHVRVVEALNILHNRCCEHQCEACGLITADKDAIGALELTEDTLKKLLFSSMEARSQKSDISKKHRCKPCPFCGGKDIKTNNTSESSFYIWCDSCGIEAINFFSEESAIEFWNKRTSHSNGSEK